MPTMPSAFFLCEVVVTLSLAKGYCKRLMLSKKFCFNAIITTATLRQAQGDKQYVCATAVKSIQQLHTYVYLITSENHCIKSFMRF